MEKHMNSKKINVIEEVVPGKEYVFSRPEYEAPFMEHIAPLLDPKHYDDGDDLSYSRRLWFLQGGNKDAWHDLYADLAPEIFNRISLAEQRAIAAEIHNRAEVYWGKEDEYSDDEEKPEWLNDLKWEMTDGFFHRPFPFFDARQRFVRPDKFEFV